VLRTACVADAAEGRDPPASVLARHARVKDVHEQAHRRIVATGIGLHPRPGLRPGHRELPAHCFHLWSYRVHCFSELFLSRIQFPCPKPDSQGSCTLILDRSCTPFLLRSSGMSVSQLSPSGDTIVGAHPFDIGSDLNFGDRSQSDDECEPGCALPQVREPGPTPSAGSQLSDTSSLHPPVLRLLSTSALPSECCLKLLPSVK
jgi:hypothetical protein